MNAWLKRYVKCGHNLVDFLHHFHQGLSYLKYNELVSNFKSTYGELILTIALELIEHCGANVYTREAFGVFLRALKMFVACVLVHCN